MGWLTISGFFSLYCLFSKKKDKLIWFIPSALCCVFFLIVNVLFIWCKIDGAFLAFYSWTNPLSFLNPLYPIVRHAVYPLGSVIAENTPGNVVLHDLLELMWVLFEFASFAGFLIFAYKFQMWKKKVMMNWFIDMDGSDDWTKVFDAETREKIAEKIHRLNPEEADVVNMFMDFNVEGKDNHPTLDEVSLYFKKKPREIKKTIVKSLRVR